jgi:SAM-dependent methyltransferase
MFEEDKLEIINFNAILSDMFSEHPKILGWYSCCTQETRFDILKGIGDWSHKTVLDVGCGYADLFKHIQRDTNYTGVDIDPARIQIAKQRYPDANVFVLDILDETIDSQFDYVVASGIFSSPTAHHTEWMWATIDKMFKLCKIGVAFNFISIHAKHKLDDYIYRDPDEILSYCKSISNNVVIKQEYLNNDATIYMHK